MGTRRTNGEGYFRKRADDRWEGQLRYIDSRGKERRVSAYGKTRKLAKIALDEKMQRLRDGVAVVDAKVVLSAVAKRWRETTLVASDRRQATKDLYASRSRLHIESGPLADIPLARLSPSHVEEWIVASREAGVSDSSLRTDYAVLRAILDAAVRDGLVARNVAAAVNRPGVARKEALHLSPTQVSQLVDAVSGSKHGLPILLAALTGMRRGEVLALRWRDIDTVAGTATVSGTLTGSGAKVRREPAAKTDSSHRTLPLGEDVTKLLDAHRGEQERARRRARNLWANTEDLVFTTETGRPVDPRNVLRTLQNAADKLDLPKGTGMHTLRHSAATALFVQGAHLKLVSSILGHSDVSITANIYGHATEGAQRAALDGLAAEVRGKKPHLRVVPPATAAGEN